MHGVILKIFLMTAGTLVCLYLMASAFRRARLLDARIREFLAEQERAPGRGYAGPFHHPTGGSEERTTPPL